MLKQFGVAHTYEAVRIHSVAVAVVAIGETANLNTRVMLEQLPWKIYPPHFGLFFEHPQIALPATRPFVVSSLFAYPADVGELTFIDANGRHVVKIGETVALSAAERRVNEEGAFLAYKQIGFPNCMIAPVDAVVPMIFARAYGPDTYTNCEAWIAQNCGKA